MLLTLFAPVVAFLNKKRSTVIDTKIFRVTTVITPSLFLALSVLYGIKEFVGQPISCVGSSKVPEMNDFAELFCWIYGTYSLEEYFIPQNRHRILYPGIGQVKSWTTTRYHKFYMWIPIFLFLLSLTFYAPRYLWKEFEKGHMKMLKDKLDTPILEDEIKRARIKLLRNYLYDTFGYNSIYATAFSFCEILSFLTCIGSFFASDLLLNHKFRHYGLDVWRYYYRNDKLHAVNPMTVVFPKMTKCEVRVYGPSGNIIPHEYLCTMAINNMNDKMYLFIWFYLIGIGALSGLAVLWRIVVVFSPMVRYMILRESILKVIRDRSTTTASKLSQLSFGDWFVLHQLSKNIDRLAYFDLLESLSQKLEGETISNLEPDLKSIVVF